MKIKKSKSKSKQILGETLHRHNYQKSPSTINNWKMKTLCTLDTEDICIPSAICKKRQKPQHQKTNSMSSKKHGIKARRKDSRKNQTITESISFKSCQRSKKIVTKAKKYSQFSFQQENKPLDKFVAKRQGRFCQHTKKPDRLITWHDNSSTCLTYSTPKIIKTMKNKFEGAIKEKNNKNGGRVKTEHTKQSLVTKIQEPHEQLWLSHLQLFTTIKNIRFYMDEKYNLDPYLVIGERNSTVNSRERILILKALNKIDKAKKECHYILRVVDASSNRGRQRCLNDLMIKEQFLARLKSQERKNFSCLFKIYCFEKKDKKKYHQTEDLVDEKSFFQTQEGAPHFNTNQEGPMIQYPNKRMRSQLYYLVYELEGQGLSWKKELHRKLLLTLPEKKPQILRHLLVEVSKAIHCLSIHGYYHPLIKLRNVLVDVEEKQESVKISKSIKLGELYHCCSVDDKKALSQMKACLLTPPEVLNYQLFEIQGTVHNRGLLDTIYKYDEGWKVSVWGLGIFLLEILNKGPLNTEFLDLKQLIETQEQLLVKYSSLVNRINDQTTKQILKRMLQVNPAARPAPSQIILSLTETTQV